MYNNYNLPSKFTYHFSCFISFVFLPLNISKFIISDIINIVKNLPYNIFYNIITYNY